MDFSSSDKTGNRPEVTLYHRSIDYLDYCEYTHVIVGVPMSLILLLFESSQFTDRKKVEHRVERKRNC